ncbi:MAG: tRNA (adenosine(37)-N6)-threonylcarbamoyltransferase complex dimerization subunit type 1 TsaB [Phycisphaerales bacterium]
MPDIGPFSLAIEVASRSGAVALGREETFLDEERVGPELRRADDLLPAIDRLMRRHRVAPSELGAVFISIGPGGFTGLRLGVTVAKMLGFATDARIVAVPTAEVVAESVAPNSGCLLVAIGSKGDRFWATVFEGTEGVWEVREAGREVDAAATDLREWMRADLVVSDRPPPGLVNACAERETPIESAAYSAAACWRVGRRRAGRGLWTSPARLAPLYGREPEAVRQWRRRDAP